MSILIPLSPATHPWVVEAEALISSVRARMARGVPDDLRVSPAIPVVVFVVVAIAAFVALALVMGAIAAYIWYCQANGLGWPGLQVPGPSGGVYKLACFK